MNSNSSSGWVTGLGAVAGIVGMVLVAVSAVALGGTSGSIGPMPTSRNAVREALQSARKWLLKAEFWAFGRSAKDDIIEKIDDMLSHAWLIPSDSELEGLADEIDELASSAACGSEHRVKQAAACIRAAID